MEDKEVIRILKVVKDLLDGGDSRDYIQMYLNVKIEQLEE